MPTKNVVVGSAVGLHARPAALIAQAATEAGVPVTIAIPGGTPVAKAGAEVVVESADEAVLEKIADLVEQDLDA